MLLRFIKCKLSDYAIDLALISWASVCIVASYKINGSSTHDYFPSVVYTTLSLAVILFLLSILVVYLLTLAFAWVNGLRKEYEQFKKHSK